MDKIFVIGKDTVPQKIRLGQGEKLSAALVILPGTDCDLSLEVDMDAPSASLDLYGVFVCKEGQTVSIKVNVRHNSGGCVSNQIFKGIASGNSKALFDGLIYVAPLSQKTKAYQQCHTILLSRDAVVEARPQLEIYADDVECSHGATSGYLNPDERFYMQSRGIPEQEARRLQMISFLSDVAEALPEDLKQQIYDSLS